MNSNKSGLKIKSRRILYKQTFFKTCHHSVVIIPESKWFSEPLWKKEQEFIWQWDQISGVRLLGLRATYDEVKVWWNIFEGKLNFYNKRGYVCMHQTFENFWRLGFFINYYVAVISKKLEKRCIIPNEGHILWYK